MNENDTRSLQIVKKERVREKRARRRRERAWLEREGKGKLIKSREINNTDEQKKIHTDSVSM